MKKSVSEKYVSFTNVHRGRSHIDGEIYKICNFNSDCVDFFSPSFFQKKTNSDTPLHPVQTILQKCRKYTFRGLKYYVRHFANFMTALPLPPARHP